MNDNNKKKEKVKMIIINKNIIFIINRLQTVFKKSKSFEKFTHKA